MGRKTKKQQLIDKITEQLRDDYRVSEKELASGSFYLSDSFVQVEDVIPFFESRYGVALRNKSFDNWQAFMETVADKVLKKKNKY